MKVRNGFVSNSSSSSFILVVNQLPSSVEETKVLLYGENPPRLTSHWDDAAIVTEQIARILYNDITDSSIMNIEDMIRSVKSEIGSFSRYNYSEGVGFVQGTKFEEEFKKCYKKITYFEDNDSQMYSGDWDYAKHYKITNELSKPMFALIEKEIRIKYNENDVFIKIEYADDEGLLYAYIEQSGVLDPITVQKFSHH